MYTIFSVSRPSSILKWDLSIDAITLEISICSPELRNSEFDSRFNSKQLIRLLRVSQIELNGASEKKLFLNPPWFSIFGNILLLEKKTLTNIKSVTWIIKIPKININREIHVKVLILSLKIRMPMMAVVNILSWLMTWNRAAFIKDKAAKVKIACTVRRALGNDTLSKSIGFSMMSFFICLAYLWNEPRIICLLIFG